MKKLKKNHEQSFIDGFSNYLSRKAQESGRQVTRCSLDGQDTVYGADYIFTNHTNFLMVEFKYDKSDVKLEGKKPRRLTLCRILDDEDGWRQLSSQCHYVAWSEFLEIDNVGGRRPRFNAYYDEVCNRAVFGEDSGLIKQSPYEESRLKAGLLVRDFLSGELGTDFQSFEVYTNWLMSLEDSGDTGIELIVDHPDEDELLLMEFTSVRELKTWLDLTAFEPPKPTPKPKPRGSSGPGMR
ncbi:hypothetical protein [Pseudomonas sp. MWU318]|uniref:hypothetical protein n=1 Tax=Pseudomonas sp. MWU318 TaxID=2802569 RepID=UPI001925BB8C|nr:hypothetical protein [Pseudomonas sp. MWU318]